MEAVIIAGGLGTRLRPVTLEIPKPLIPVQGRTLTEHVLDLLKEAGVTHVYLSVGHLAERIKGHFGDGSGFGVRISYVEETEPLGTGGWLRMVPRIKGDFIVVNGDNLFDLDFKAMIAAHRRHQATVTVALTKTDDVASKGVAALEGERITAFVEKPKPEEAPSDLANSGYYLFNERVFDHLPAERKFMLERDLFPQLASEGKLYGFVSDGQWFDTGTFERWAEVIEKWRKG
jgi:mannose-1-phosphate guanylyltransferase